MGLIDIGDVEAAIGETIPGEDEGRVQWYIDTVSEFIERYTGRAFSEQEDVEYVTKANSWGFIEFAELTSVSLVELLDGGSGTWMDVTPYGYRFDGLGSIYNLVPYATYRVTVSYGDDDVPLDIQGIIALLVAAGTGYDPSAVGGLTKIKTGNVEDTYGVSASGSVTLSELMRGTLEDYDVGMATP